MPIWTHRHTYRLAYTHTHACMDRQTNRLTHIYRYTHIYTHTHRLIHTHRCICTQIDKYLHTCTHTQNYTFTQHSKTNHTHSFHLFFGHLMKDWLFHLWSKHQTSLFRSCLTLFSHFCLSLFVVLSSFNVLTLMTVFRQLWERGVQRYVVIFHRTNFKFVNEEKSCFCIVVLVAEGICVFSSVR